MPTVSKQFFNNKGQIKNYALLSLAYSLIFTLILTLTVLMRFYNEFSLSPLALILYFLPTCFVAALVIFIISLIPKAARFWFSLLAALSFLFILEGNFLAKGLPALDGNISNYINPFRTIVDSLVWLAVIAAALFGSQKLYEKRNTVLLIALVLALAGLGDAYITKRGLPPKLGQMSSREALEGLQFNKDNNVIVFVLDSVSSELAEELFTKDTQLAESFPGFINFTNVIGMYGQTLMAIPSIVSGQYRSQEIRVNHYNKIFGKDSLLIFFQSHDYHVVFSSILGFSSFSSIQRLPGLLDQSARYSNSFFSTHIRDLAIFQYLPYGLKYMFLKSLQHIVPGHIRTGLSSGAATEQAILRAQLKADKAVFAFFHFVGAHPPFLTTSTCSVAEVERSGYQAYYDKGRCAFLQIAGLLNDLKIKKIYDSSTIIILGDHSAGISNSPKLQALPGLAYPMLMLKPKNNSQPLTNTASPVSLSKLASCLKEYVNSDYSLTLEQITSHLSQDKRLFVEHHNDNDDIINYYIDQDYNIQVVTIPVSKSVEDLQPLNSYIP